MPKPQLKNIEEHLQFLVGERNPFTQPDHMEKARLYITKKIESFNLLVNQEAVDSENNRSFNIIGKPADISSTSFVFAAHYDTKPETPGAGGNFREVRLSDHAPFWDAVIPAMMVTDTAFFCNPHYHQSTDTLETFDIEFIRENAEVVAETLKTLPQKK
jgi:hypothetical protein